VRARETRNGRGGGRADPACAVAAEPREGQGGGTERRPCALAEGVRVGTEWARVRDPARYLAAREGSGWVRVGKDCTEWAALSLAWFGEQELWRMEKATDL
jgi:hypothetical protein